MERIQRSKEITGVRFIEARAEKKSQKDIKAHSRATPTEFVRTRRSLDNETARAVYLTPRFAIDQFPIKISTTNIRAIK